MRDEDCQYCREMTEAVAEGYAEGHAAALEEAAGLFPCNLLHNPHLCPVGEPFCDNCVAAARIRALKVTP